MGPQPKAKHHSDGPDDVRLLGTIELAVVECERQLAEQQALLVDSKKQDRDVSQAELALEMMRETQRQHEHDRQRLLSLLQP